LLSAMLFLFLFLMALVSICWLLRKDLDLLPVPPSILEPF
jgi:hypothetical protein